MMVSRGRVNTPRCNLNIHKETYGEFCFLFWGLKKAQKSPAKSSKDMTKENQKDKQK